jgi:hypothetical protein
VEAGVDFDFPVVYRAMGPLDAIAQAAGRCNRNGRCEQGKVVVFVPESRGDERLYPDNSYHQAADVTESLLKSRGAAGMDIDSPELFEEYYRMLYRFAEPEKSEPELRDAIKCMDFEDVARLYRVIEKDAINVLVPYKRKVFKLLASHARNNGLSRRWINAARQYCVGLFKPRADSPIQHFLEPIKVGKGEMSEEWFIYRGREEDYDQARGLVIPESPECLIA